MFLLPIATFFTLQIMGAHGIQHDFNGCNLMVYKDNGMFSARDTLFACSAQMASPLSPVTYDVNYKGNLTVVVQMVRHLKCCS
jgi:hypothetical protein